ncbi:MAG: tRNA (guanosine(46)-N7)-methyltransferase TrmB [Ardenticatenaceae bacterium]|nr:tRNA (guanosine(46)-N7)-methyltransferase TrmB [Ardenticatenaceae bacterium]
MTLKAYDVSRLAWPTDWDSLFGRSGPLFVEIGFGNAEFLVDLAVRHPDANMIGVEISLPSIKKAERKAGRLPTPNVVLVHGDAKVLLWGAIQRPVDRFYINFPDPWHKAAHHHRKLINDHFLTLLAGRMAEGGQLNIATDDPGYQEVIEDCLARTPYFVPRYNEPYLLNDPDRLVTKYEQKALREGRQPRYYLWRRNGQPAESRLKAPQELQMPHVVVRSPRPLTEIADRFSPQRFDGDIPVRLIQMFQALDPADKHQDMLLIETHVAEDPMPQRVALFIQARADGDWLIACHDLGFPRPTVGIHTAVGRLVEWLLSLDLGIEIIRHNLAIKIGS